jgi:hypothetical protein
MALKNIDLDDRIANGRCKEIRDTPWTTGWIQLRESCCLSPERIISRDKSDNGSAKGEFSDMF